MVEENNSDKDSQNGEESTEYGDILSDFSNVLDDESGESEQPEVDHDGMAISEILGEDVTADGGGEKPQEPETSQEDQDYSDLLKDLGGKDDEDSGDLDIDALTVEDETAAGEESSVESDAKTIPPTTDIEIPEEDTAVSDESDFDIPGDIEEPAEEQAEDVSEPDEAAPEPEPAVLDLDAGDEVSAGSEEGEGGLDLDFEDSESEAEVSPADTEMVIDESEAVPDDGYASLLGEMGDESSAEVAGESGKMDVLSLDEEESEDLSFIELDSSKESESSAEDETSGEEAFVVADEGSDEESDFLDLDFGGDSEDVETEVAEEEPGITIPSAEETEDEDFLGLSDESESKKEEEDFTGVSSGTYSEVMFEGVEMNFDEQASLVTRAELLLAQKKRVEAAELFKQAAEKKGETHWVSKRLEELS